MNAENEKIEVTEAPRQWFKLLDSVTLKLTRAQAVEAAKKHLALPDSPTERDFDQRHANSLIDRIKGGVWLPCNWATVLYEAVPHRQNGRHSSYATIEGAEWLPELVVIHLDSYEAPDAPGMGMLFRQFDARLSMRTLPDVAGAYQGLVRELKQIPRKKAKLGVEGIAFYERVIERLRVPPKDELYQFFFLAKYHPFLRWLDRVLTVKTPEMNEPAVIGTMYQTFITSESGAQDFWPHVAKSDLNNDTDPRVVLSAELTKIKEGVSAKTMRKPAPMEFYIKCVKAWNAFRAGESIRTLPVNIKKGIPDIAA